MPLLQRGKRRKSTSDLWVVVGQQALGSGLGNGGLPAVLAGYAFECGQTGSHQQCNKQPACFRLSLAAVAASKVDQEELQVTGLLHGSSFTVQD